MWTPRRRTLPEDEPLPAVLQDMVDRADKAVGLTKNERLALTTLIRDYSDIFSLHPDDIGRCTWRLFEIHTTLCMSS